MTDNVPSACINELIKCVSTDVCGTVSTQSCVYVASFSDDCSSSTTQAGSTELTSACKFVHKCEF